MKTGRRHVFHVTHPVERHFAAETFYWAEEIEDKSVRGRGSLIGEAVRAFMTRVDALLIT